MMSTLNITSVNVAELTIDRLNLPTMGLLPELLVLLLLLLLISVGLQLRAICYPPRQTQLLLSDGL